MSQPTTLAWLAEHELRLGWRDWVALMTAGRGKRARTVAVALIVIAVLMHLLAYSMIARHLARGVDPDKATLLVVTGTLILSWSLVLSQAMESVTRAFYARADLDLILTSPLSPRKIFAVRIGRIAVSVAARRDCAGCAVHRCRGGNRRAALARRATARSPPWAWLRPQWRSP